VTVYTYSQVLVWDNLGGGVRVARNQRITVTDPATGAVAAGLTQSGQPVTSVTSDGDGHVTFASTMGVVRLTSARGFWQDAESPDLRTNATASTSQATLARTPDSLITGTVTRDANGAATSAPVVWPDGAPGTYTALIVSTTFPGAVDSYKITYGSPATKTYTQPTVTRDTNGAAITVPAITVS